MTASITGETWGETIEPVREHLLRESTQPLAVLRPKLEAAHAELLGALDGVTPAQAQLRPGADPGSAGGAGGASADPGGPAERAGARGGERPGAGAGKDAGASEDAGEDAWGIAEVLRHVASSGALMAERVRLLGAGHSTESLRPSQPGSMHGVDSRDLAELKAELQRSYAALEAAIDSIQGHERLDTLAAHRRFGELNCRGWIALHTLHVQDHARQVATLKRLSSPAAAEPSQHGPAGAGRSEHPVTDGAPSEHGLAGAGRSEQRGTDARPSQHGPAGAGPREHGAAAADRTEPQPR